MLIIILLFTVFPGAVGVYMGYPWAVSWLPFILGICLVAYVWGKNNAYNEISKEKENK